MIARVWRGRARPGTADDYVRHLETAVFPELDGMDGFRGARILRRAVPDGVEFVVETRWESRDAIRQFAGDDVKTAVVPPEARALLAEWDERVRHFDIVR